MSTFSTTVSDKMLLLGHTSEDTALVVDDYPYGRQRTKIRYWIESVKGRGDRFVSQTLNPKTDRWNKPKKGTYSPVIFMHAELQDDGREFVKTVGLSIYSDAETLAEWESAVDSMNDLQKVEFAKLIGREKVMRHVKFSIHEGPVTPEHEAEQAEIGKQINRAVAVESFRAHQEIAS